MWIRIRKQQKLKKTGEVMTDYSVLMSVYEKEKPEYLKAAIDSILNQTHQTNDFVLVCDGPLGEGLEDVIADFVKTAPGLFHIFRLSKNMGLAKALNHGIMQCKNEIIVRMDSDDISASERVSKQLKAMEEEGVDIVGSNIMEFTDSINHTIQERRVPEKHKEIIHFAKKRSPFNHPSVIYKKSAVIDCGLYEDYQYFEDYHLWAVMLKKRYRGYNVQENLLYMRAGENLYKRRGGFKYIKCIWRFENSLRRLGYINTVQFLIQSFSRMLISLIPNKLRKTVYAKLLRKNEAS